jgi:hypothetical protein
LSFLKEIFSFNNADNKHDEIVESLRDSIWSKDGGYITKNKAKIVGILIELKGKSNFEWMKENSELFLLRKVKSYFDSEVDNGQFRVLNKYIYCKKNHLFK